MATYRAARRDTTDDVGDGNTDSGKERTRTRTRQLVVGVESLAANGAARALAASTRGGRGDREECERGNGEELGEHGW